MADETQEQVAQATETQAPAQSETDWKAEADKWKALARKNEERAKANAAADDAARRLQSELEQERAAKQSDLENLSKQVTELQSARDAEIRARREAEVRAAAAGKLADPADALRLLDVESLESADDIAAAVDRLVSEKPYLSGGTPRRFEGAADAGPRDGEPVTGAKQLTAEDVKQLSPDQIAEAFAAGRMKNLGFG
jgi:membrane protein involved in colicin uptake